MTIHRGATRVIVLVFVVGLAAAWYVALPPHMQPPAAPAAKEQRVLRGAIHVHTRRSDGTGTVEEVAAAAARADLDFVVFTDHGDGTRSPDPPQYRDGVLCIDAVEISTLHGHVLALGLPRAPYPLGGEARAVVDDIARLGGFAIAAHPHSNKPELDWSDWTVPVAGLEWLNGDSQWRDESGWSLARALFTYPARGIETLVSLLDRPEAALRQWDALASQRPVIAVAGADAHARIGLRSLGEPYDNSASVHIPSYERMFRLFSNVVPDTTLTGDPAADSASVLTAIRAGRLYSVVDALGAGTLSFTAQAGETRAHAGDVVPTAAPLTIRVDMRGPSDARIELWKNGAVAATSGGARLEYSAPSGDAPGVYRVEVLRGGAPGEPPIPWLVSNPIRVGQPPAQARSSRKAATSVVSLYTNGPATDWAIETSLASRAALDVVSGVRGQELALRYALGGAASASPFAAFALTAGPDVANHDRLVFTARADRPMRLSVQLREPAGEAGHRWQQSVYLDTEPREVTVHFDDVRPVGDTPRARPTLASVASILFVVDTVNTPLGGNGRIWIDDVKYAR